MGYIQATLHLRMIGWIGDSLDELYPHFFVDADFAGDIDTQRSTSGLFFCDTRAELVISYFRWQQAAILCVSLNT